MSQITNGHVSFGRTVKTGDFENKKVEVLLAFSVEEGENVEAAIDNVSRLAQEKAHQMLGIAPAAKPAAKPAPAPAETKAEPAKPAAAKPPKPAAKPAEAPKPAPAPAEADPLDMGVEAAPAESVDPSDGLDDILEAAPPPITDKDLVTEITLKNGVLKNPVAIKQLIWKFAGSNKHAHDIPAAVRAIFVKELKAL